MKLFDRAGVHEAASGGRSITLRETSRSRADRIEYTPESDFAYTHTRACTYTREERGRLVLKWARGPLATHVRCIIISASLCCYAIRVR